MFCKFGLDVDCKHCFWAHGCQIIFVESPCHVGGINLFLFFWSAKLDVYIYIRVPVVLEIQDNIRVPANLFLNGKLKGNSIIHIDVDIIVFKWFGMVEGY